MPTNYPGGLDTAAQLPTSVADSTPQVTVHAAYHDTLAGAMVAAETKLGTGASTPTANQVLTGSGAGASAWQSLPVSISATFLAPTGTVTIFGPRINGPTTITAVYARRAGGTGATVNVYRNGSLALLAADLSITSNQAWTSGGAVQNGAFADGDSIEFRVQTVTGTPTDVEIQVDGTRP